MLIEDLNFELALEPGWTAAAEPLDADAARALRRLLTDAGPGPLTVQVGPTDTQDVSGHAAQGATIDVLISVGDDVEGHAFSLHFPSQEEAQRMRLRLAAGGLLIAALTVGSIGVASQAPVAQTVAPPAAQAVPQAPAAPFINRGLNADIRSGDIVEEEAGTVVVAAGLGGDIRSAGIQDKRAAASPVTTAPAVHLEEKN